MSIKKDHKNILQIFLKIKKFKKEIMLTIELKICHMQIEKEKGNVREIIIIKEKIQLNNLINCVKELENLSLNK